MSSDFCDITKLADFFHEVQGNNENSGSESEGDDQQQPENNHTDTERKDQQSSSKKISPYSKLDVEEKRRTKENDDENEFLFDDEQTTLTKGDWKACPHWEISYRQQVTPSDVYLQMGPKNPTTASCEDMIITVHLPQDKRPNIDLKVLVERLQVTSPKHYLDIPLPHPVDPKLGNAQWDNEKEKLIVTLKMKREFDFMNF